MQSHPPWCGASWAHSSNPGLARIIIAGVMFLLGFSFWSMLEGLNSDPTPVPITQLFYETLYFWLIL